MKDQNFEEFFVFFGEEKKGQGVIAEYCDGTWTPFVTCSQRNLAVMKERAKNIAKHSGNKITLYKFTKRIEVEEFKP